MIDLLASGVVLLLLDQSSKRMVQREPEPGANRFNIYHAISAVMIILSLATLTAFWPR